MPGLMLLPLAYDADDEIDRVVVIGEIVLGVVLIVIGLALMRRLQGAPERGRNRWARRAAVVVALGIGAYALGRLIPDDSDQPLLALAIALFLVTWLVGVAGPVLAVFGLDLVRYQGERRLAVAAFVASLVLPGIFVANVVACAVTDACFH
jgi:hypothetical protein